MYHYHYDSNRLAHLYDLKYQQGTATHLRTAQKQALQGDDLTKHLKRRRRLVK